ncbi:hypothetical protein ACIRD9_19565 [Streptomyces violaceus]|uniref:hypothetical protein n=1 Tax=Streptomyces violaceus TaxID=1936 RepID=UPI00382DC169
MSEPALLGDIELRRPVCAPELEPLAQQLSAPFAVGASRTGVDDTPGSGRVDSAFVANNP